MSQIYNEAWDRRADYNQRRNFGDNDGVGTSAKFKGLDKLVVDELDSVYVADIGHHLIRKISPSASVSTVVGVSAVAGSVTGLLPGVIGSVRAVAVYRATVYIVFYNGVVSILGWPSFDEIIALTLIAGIGAEGRIGNF